MLKKLLDYLLLNLYLAVNPRLDRELQDTKANLAAAYDDLDTFAARVDELEAKLKVQEGMTSSSPSTEFVGGTN